MIQGAKPARRKTGADACAIASRMARGFSLMELMVVMAVAVLLAGMLLPSLAHVRENVNRVICASNQRQIGMAIFMFERSQKSLPRSRFIEHGEFAEGMAAARGEGERSGEQRDDWDGLGLLFQLGYCDTPHVYYCPSHQGEHTLQRYEMDWFGTDENRIYTNYHYLGDRNWRNGHQMSLDRGPSFILVTDGLRSARDFNHESGLNMLLSDGSVRWREDARSESLAAELVHADEFRPDDWADVWDSLYELVR